MCYPVEFCRSMLNVVSVIKEIHLKNWFLASCLSRSLKVIWNDTDRYAIYDFLLTFPSNHEPILYRMRDKRRFQWKIEKKIPTSVRAFDCDAVMYNILWQYVLRSLGFFYLFFTYEHKSLTYFKWVITTVSALSLTDRGRLTGVGHLITGGFWPEVAFELGGVWPQGANDREVWPGEGTFDWEGHLTWIR